MSGDTVQGVSPAFTVPVLYCWSWENNKVIETLPTQPDLKIDEAEARRRYADPKGELFTVAVGDPVVVVLNVRWSTGFAGVKFVDDRARWYRSDQYTLIDGRLFRTGIATWLYQQDEENYHASRIVNERYFPDGRRIINDRNMRTRQLVTDDNEEALTAAEVALQWEPLPEFGHWANLCRFDRQQDLHGQPDWYRALY